MIKVPEMIKHGIWYLTVRFEEFCQHPSQFFEVKNPKNGVQEFWMVLCVLPFQHAICLSSSQFNIYASVHKKSIQKNRCIGFNNSTTNACNNQVLNFSIDELVNVGVLLSGALAFYNFANISICTKNYSMHKLYYVFQNCVVVCNLPL